MKEEEARLIERNAENRRRILRNNLFLVSGLNMITLLLFIFAMSYYKWFYVLITIKLQPEKQVRGFWVNLLYVYHNGYIKYEKASQQVCGTTQDICTSTFEQLKMIGIICFSVFMLANVLQLYDLAKVLYDTLYRRTAITKSNKFGHIFTIGTFLLGLSIYVFAALVMDNVDGSHFGLCFYMSFVSVMVFVLVIIYEQISLRRMIKQEMILQLLETQRQYQPPKIQMERHESSDSFVL